MARLVTALQNYRKMLCNVCSSIHFKPLRESYALAESIDLEEQWDDDLYYFHRDKDSLRASSENGCHLCAKFWHHLFIDIPSWRKDGVVDPELKDQVYLKVAIIFSGMKQPPDWGFGFFFQRGHVFLSYNGRSHTLESWKEMPG